MLLAGTMCDLALLLCTAAVWHYGLLPPRADHVMLGFSCAQILLVAIALLPNVASVGNGAWSDGRRIAFILKQKKGSLTPVAACHMRSLAPNVIARDQVAAFSPASLRLIHIHHDLLHRDRQLPIEIVEAVIAELGKDEMSLEEELMVLDTLVSKAVVNGDLNLRTGMDEWSSRAMARGAHISTIRFSRAAVLIELGRFAEGKLLIETSEHAQNHPYDAILNSIFLAKAEAGLGNQGRSDELLGQAGIRIRGELSSKPQAEAQALWRRIKDSLAGQP